MTSIITLCIVIATFIAISVIISKAGYSRAWALIPFAPLVTWIATLVMAKIQLHTFVVFSGVGTLLSAFNKHPSRRRQDHNSGLVVISSSLRLLKLAWQIRSRTRRSTCGEVPWTKASTRNCKRRCQHRYRQHAPSRFALSVTSWPGFWNDRVCRGARRSDA